MEDVFPHNDTVDYSKLQMTPEGLYSITRRRDSEKIVQYLKDTIGDLSKKTITDATACVGGDSIQFALSFHKVHSVEWKHDNFIVLRNNVQAYGLQNITIHEGDVTKLLNWKTDVLYIDPPWGGPDYHTLRSLDVFLGNIRMDVWLESILKEDKYPKHIVLKLPRNYNFTRLHFLPNVESVYFYRIRGFVLVLLVTS
jgi:16S rRNA G966 N2-methylase RsmD